MKMLKEQTSKFQVFRQTPPDSAWTSRLWNASRVFLSKNANPASYWGWAVYLLATCPSHCSDSTQQDASWLEAKYTWGQANQHSENFLELNLKFIEWNLAPNVVYKEAERNQDGFFVNNKWDFMQSWLPLDWLPLQKTISMQKVIIHNDSHH